MTLPLMKITPLPQQAWITHSFSQNDGILWVPPLSMMKCLGPCASLLLLTTTAVNLWVQPVKGVFYLFAYLFVFASPPPRRYHFSAHFPIRALACSLELLYYPSLGRGVRAVTVEARDSTIIYSQHLEQLQVSLSTTPCCNKKLL